MVILILKCIAANMKLYKFWYFKFVSFIHFGVKGVEPQRLQVLMFVIQIFFKMEIGVVKKDCKWDFVLPCSFSIPGILEYNVETLSR